MQATLVPRAADLLVGRLGMIEKIKRKLKILRVREQQAINDMNFAECLKLEGAIFHIEDLYQYAMSASQPAVEADAQKPCRFCDGANDLRTA